MSIGFISMDAVMQFVPPILPGSVIGCRFDLVILSFQKVFIQNHRPTFSFSYKDTDSWFYQIILYLIVNNFNRYTCNTQYGCDGHSHKELHHGLNKMMCRTDCQLESCPVRING